MFVLGFAVCLVVGFGRFVCFVFGCVYICVGLVLCGLVFEFFVSGDLSVGVLACLWLIFAAIGLGFLLYVLWCGLLVFALACSFLRAMCCCLG